MRISHGLRAAAGLGGFDFLDSNNIGLAVEGGYFAGLISHTANGVATHALIVAPRATGAKGTGYPITPNPLWQTTKSTTGATSPYDGQANTALLTNSPAADFCTGLTIDGFSDWYLPTRYELDIAYFHLKPTTTSNSTSWGINDYSVPKRTSNYTAGSPAQTSVAAFQSGGGEDFSTSSHWASNEYSFDLAWRLQFTNGAHGQSDKLGDEAVRAFRKVAL